MPIKKNKVKKRKRVTEKTEKWSGRKHKTVDNISENYFYSIPNSKLLTLLILISIIIAVALLCLFKFVYKQGNDLSDTNSTVGSYLSLIALPVGVVLSFIVASAWTTFANAQDKEDQEATELLQLYSAVNQLPGNESILTSIEDYTQFIIDVEFPLMEQGVQSQIGTTMLFDIGDAIYEIEPMAGRENAIYSQAINIYREVVSLRIARMGYTTNGIAAELWWVLILGVVVVIFCSFFICVPSLLLQCFMTALAVTALVSMLFLILALNYPYRGDFGLDSVPFQIALYQMELRN